MVAGAHSMGALGAIRSLGRAGYSVHALSPSPEAIGLRSNFARYSEVHPQADDPAFEVWAKRYMQSHDIKLIIPGGPISPNGHPLFKEYLHLFPVESDAAVRANGRKYELFAGLLSGQAEHKANLPPLLLVEFKNGLPGLEKIERLGSPVFLKFDGAHSKTNRADQVIRCDSAKDAFECLERSNEDYEKVVLQGYVPGTGVGAFFLRWNGQTRATFMHRRLHEMPHTGGASSLRESWWHDKILKDAEAKLAHTGWHGVAMVEYRWDPLTDKFYLMEMNLRFWGSLHLALYSGIDFPKLLAEHFLQQNNSPIPKPIIGLKCRNTIPFEIGYLVSLWRDRSVPIVRKLYSILEAIYLSLDFRVKNDLLFPGDTKLFWYRAIKFLRTGQ